jgi:aldose sugar dehydrogenase
LLIFASTIDNISTFNTLATIGWYDLESNKGNYMVNQTLITGLEYPTGIAFLGPDDILVLEQDKGAVQRIVNGQISEEPILNVNVLNQREKYGQYEERGLLGIAVSKNFTNHKTYVFLYYTEVAEKKSVEVQEEEEERGGSEQAVRNRLYRYELSEEGSKLVNPKILLDLPGERNNPSHSGGAIAIGPDNNVYVAIGNLNGPAHSKGPEDNVALNAKDGEEPDGRGGILRVTQDGQVVNDSGVLGDAHPLNMYYAYGIRNSFGLAFDPLTGNLWDTENGGEYDEINRVELGFNSGWRKVSGEAFLTEEFDIEDDLVDFDGKGKYSDPEFSWIGGAAPTAITFFHSGELGKAYENDIFVGSYKGNIYHFQLANDRTELTLDGTLVDKVADTPEEVKDIVFATGLGIIADLEVGPDGYLYGTSYDEEGSIFRIGPRT